MQNIFKLNLMINPAGNAGKGKSKTPKDIGDGIFQALLKKKSKEEPEGIWGFSPYGGHASIQGFNKQAAKSGGMHNPIMRLREKLAHFGIPVGKLRLPERSLLKLVKFLEAQGIKREKIDQLINSAKDQDGLIRLDALMSKLMSQGIGQAIDQKSGMIIPSRDIPQLEEALFKTGMGVGEVKKVVERSLNMAGDLEMEKFSGALEKYSPKLLPRGKLMSILEQLGIKWKPNILKDSGLDPQMNEAFKMIAGADSKEMQKAVKQDLAAMLTKKGIPPQEVKAFLENLNIDYAKSALTKADLKLNGPLSGRLEIVSTDLMNRVVIRPQTKMQDRNWLQRIIDVLKKDRIVNTEDIEKNWFQGKAPIKLNMAELIQQAGQKEKSPVFEFLSRMRNAQQPEIISNTKSTIGSENKPNEGLKGTPVAKETFENFMGIDRAEKIFSQANAVSQAKNAVNLPQPLPRIINRMVWMIQTGEQRASIHISPPELGRLDLDLVIRHGHLHANLSAENPLVKELIEANLGQLKQQLTDQGFIIDKFEVSVGIDEKTHAESDNTKNGSGKRNSSQKHGPTEDEIIAEAEAIKPSIINEREVDVHV